MPPLPIPTLDERHTRGCRVSQTWPRRTISALGSVAVVDSLSICVRESHTAERATAGLLPYIKALELYVLANVTPAPQQPRSIFGKSLCI